MWSASMYQVNQALSAIVIRGKEHQDFHWLHIWKDFKNYWLNYAQVDYKEMIWLWEMFLKGERLPNVVNGKGHWFKTVKEMRIDQN